jgi:hypothetical protein
MKIKTLAVVLALAGSAAACEDTIGPTADDQIVLEVEFINYAFNNTETRTGNTYFGWYIDGGGRVIRYDQDLVEKPDLSANEWTLRELDAKWGIRFEVGRRPQGEVAALLPKVAAAAAGALSAPRTACADAGTLTYRAYTYDKGRQVYTRVLLRVEGDVAQENTSQAARDLVAYIRSLNLLAEIPGCDP